MNRLLAIEEIKQLKARYFRFLDTKDWAGLTTVFTPDAVSNPSVNGVPNGYGGLNWTNFQVSQPVSCAQAPSQSG